MKMKLEKKAEATTKTSNGNDSSSGDGATVTSKLKSLSLLTYSDLAEAERTLILEKFRQTTMRWNQKATAQSGDDSEFGKEEHKSHMIVVTDACLPLLASGESPISARVLINYELPTKKIGLKTIV